MTCWTLPSSSSRTVCTGSSAVNARLKNVTGSQDRVQPRGMRTQEPSPLWGGTRRTCSSVSDSFLHNADEFQNYGHRLHDLFAEVIVHRSVPHENLEPIRESLHLFKHGNYHIVLFRDILSSLQYERYRDSLYQSL